MKYAAFIRYAKPERIAEVRPDHRRYRGSLNEQGKVFASDLFTDDSGALIIYGATSEQEARQLIADHPFNEAGVFAEIQLKEWNQVF